MKSNWNSTDGNITIRGSTKRDCSFLHAQKLLWYFVLANLRKIIFILCNLCATVDWMYANRVLDRPPTLSNLLIHIRYKKYSFGCLSWSRCTAAHHSLTMNHIYFEIVLNLFSCCFQVHSFKLSIENPIWAWLSVMLCLFLCSRWKCSLLIKKTNRRRRWDSFSVSKDFFLCNYCEYCVQRW